MLRHSAKLPALFLAIAAAGAAVAAERAKPSRIVSINLCTDQILFDLVAPRRIAALSYLAADASVSAISGEMKGLATVRGHAEEVLALEPDLVLAGSYTTPATVSLLRRLGRRVVVVPLARDFAGIRRGLRDIAAAVGETARAEVLIARFESRLAAVAAGSAGAKPSAIVYRVNSLVAGGGGLADAALTAAGYRNLAASMELGAGGRLALETLLSNPPDLIVLGARAESYRTTAADNLRHPAFRKLIADRAVLRLPEPLLLCGTHRIAGAVELLAGARAAVARRRPAAAKVRAAAPPDVAPTDRPAR